MKKYLKTLSFVALIIYLTFSVSGIVFAAVQTIIHTSKDDFAAGTVGSTLDINQSPGDIRLKYKLNEYTDTADTDFKTNGITNASLVTSNNGGNVQLSKILVYNTSSVPAISNNSIYNSFEDANNHLLYLSTAGGLSVINTQGTSSPSDDTLVITYSTTSTPAIANNSVKHAFLDETRNLLYISTGGGLSVINTQGTVTPTDDVLVITYSTTSTPAIASNTINHAFFDPVNNQIYASTASGTYQVSIISTQGTISTTDDTVQNRSSSGINVWSTYLDPVTHWLYISCSGGMDMYDTKGTPSLADDYYIGRHYSSTTPPIAGDTGYYTFTDNANHLDYVGTRGGLSVLDNKGTVTKSDDVNVFTYSPTSTPAIGSGWVEHGFIDPETHYLYISTLGGGLSVIDTHGTATISDDTLLTTYTMANSGLPNNNVYASFKGSDGNIYVSTTGGLAVITSSYLHSGTYTKWNSFENGANWESKNPMTTGTIAGSIVSVSDKIYVLGGYTGAYVNTVNEYNPTTNTWITKTPIPGNRAYTVAGVVNGKIYLIGGYSGTYENTTFMYDPATDNWTTKAAMPEARIYAASTVVNDKIYVIGGSNGTGMKNTVYEYDTINDIWNIKTPLTIPTYNALAAVVDGKIYLIGGYADGSYTDKVSLYDPVTDTWIAKASLPIKLSVASSISLQGNIYVFGGRNNVTAEVLDSVYIYLPALDRWELGGKLPGAMANLMTTVFNNDVYSCGGTDTAGTRLATMYKLSGTNLSDENRSEAYASLSWQATIPDGTSIDMQYSLDGGTTYASLGSTPGSYILPPNIAQSLKYKAVFSTTNDTLTPTLDSVTVSYAKTQDGLYSANSGEYLSSIVDARRSVIWKSLTLGSATPEGTSLDTFVRTGNVPVVDGSWSPWSSAPLTIPASKSRYLQYKVNFKTSVNDTPVLKSVTLTYDNDSSYSAVKGTNTQAEPEVTITVTPTVSPAEITTIPSLFTTLITDKDGHVLVNTVVYIDDQKYISDSHGAIYLERKVDVSLKIQADINNKKVSGAVIGEKIVINTVKENEPVSKETFSYWWLVVPLIITIAGYLYRRMKKQNETS